MITGLASAVAIGFTVWASRSNAGRLGTTEIQLLVSLTGERRTEGRLTGGFLFAPASSSDRKRGLSQPLSYDARLAIARLEKFAADSSGGAADHHNLARARILEHRFTEAESILKRLTATAPTPDLWSDLSAALLSVGGPQEIAAAVSAAERALTKAPTHPEALFNRALAVERLRLVRQAASAWDAYLEVDSISPWANEARSRLARLKDVPSSSTTNVRALLLAALDADDPTPARRLVTDSTQDVRDLVEDELMSVWSERMAAPNAATRSRGRAMRAIVEAVTERTGDRLLQESVSVHLAATPRRRAALREAHAQYAQGRALYERYSFSAAIPLFLAAADTMKRHGDPFWRWGTFYTAAITYQQNDLRGAHRDLTRLDAQSKRYGAVLARVAWLSGIVAASWNNFDEAFECYRRALTYFQKAGERDNIAAVHGLLADTYLLLGAEQRAWESQFEALSINLGLLRARRQQLVAFTGMQAAIRTGSPEAALYFNSAFIDAARLARNVTTAAEGELHRARLYYQLRDCTRAAASLGSAAALLSQAEASGGVDFIRAQMLLAEAGATDCQTSLDRVLAFSTAVDTFQRSTRALWLPRALLARAREWRRQGHSTEAELDLRAGIELLERSARTLASGALRVEYTDEVWDLFDEMMDLQLAGNQPERAWEFAEKGRVQASREHGNALGARAVTNALPAGHALLYYALTKTQVVLFVFFAGDFTAHRLEPDAASLTERIRAFTTRLQAGQDDARTRALSEQLYEDVMSKGVAKLPEDTHVHIVADGPLHQLPFHALRAPGSTRYAFERFLMSGAPSATSLLSARKADSVGSTVSALVLGDPAGDDFGAALPRLPDAAREATTVASLYNRSHLYVGERATRDVLLGGMAKARVVHFAGHAIVDERHPELSRLILASSTDGGPRHVLMRELADIALPQTQVVVLAACATGSGPVFKGRGALSLASPFVSAGVPTVVSTLWPIDDRSGGRLFSEFQRHVAAGVEPGQAMRRAQLAVKTDPSLTPWIWAAASMFTTLKTH